MHRQWIRVATVLATALVFGLAATATAGAQPANLGTADYARAEKVLDYHLKGRIKNARVEPHWLSDGRFWYRRDGEHGAEYLLVDPAARTRGPLFDAARLRAAASAALPAAPLAPISVSLESVGPENKALHLRLPGDSKHELSCDLLAYRCAPVPAMTPDRYWLTSPDGRRAVFVRDHNLWLRDLRSGEERALTHDGEAHFGYGELPDFALHAVQTQQGQWKVPPFALTWSPDGKRLFGTRYDERKVEPYPMVAMAPEHGFRPQVHYIRLGLLGDREAARDEWYSIDVERGATRSIRLPPGWNGAIEADVLGWSPDHRRAYAVTARYDHPARMRLVEVGLDDGKVREVIEERSDTRVQLNDFIYSRPAVRVLAASHEVVWFSERDGWGHLYLYDLRDGRMIRRLTAGDWLVRDIIGIDEGKRQLYFTAGGREPGDPYERRLYRVGLDGGEPRLLTPEAADHDLDSGVSVILGGEALDLLSPTGTAVVDNYSTLDTPPRTVLRSTQDGEVLLELEHADASAVLAAGWKAPQRVRLKAADGRTDLYATVFFPPGYSSEGAKPAQYPIIDAFYGGPQVTNAPVGFAEAASAINPVSRSSLAALGFVVITIDARGTPGRSQAFHDASYHGGFADTQVDDHVAAIGELAARYPGLDLERVGVYGHSAGGHASARAILRRPDFYKVAVSSAGNHNQQGMYGGGINGLERILAGAPDYGASGVLRPSPDAVPANYVANDNAVLAANLRGKLMLVYGDLDENALPAVTIQLTSALIKANKDFDLLYLPNQNHELFRNDAYYTRRMWDYFVEHLMGAKPPQDYRLQPPPKQGGGGY
ncbi:DPP IV N-terminal domain-containing protein [Lysobacter sp. CA196]|uniref:S9 family peptidase n=1 Tax=Lysobacter sp. CA196 TaxID=3455606 RepID=UPI003F8D0ED7